MQLPFAIRDLGQRHLRGIPVRVGSGINHNMKWSIVTTGRGYGSGSFGVARVEALRAVVRPGDCFWDVGAHKGFMTLAASQLAGSTGEVVSFEPSARNRWFIDRHLTWNTIANVRLLPIALSENGGEALFGGRGDSLAYHLGQGDETVPVRSVSDVIAEHGVRPPDVMKIDAEGQEAGILRGAGDDLRPDAALLISVHGRDLLEECMALFDDRGFRTFPSHEMALCISDPERPWRSDYDLLAVGPDRDVDEDGIRALPLVTGAE